MTTKVIFFTGGVLSSVGKGVTAAAIGRLLKARGFNITIQKLDPYLNVDRGHRSYQHGEVFVLTARKPILTSGIMNALRLAPDAQQYGHDWPVYQEVLGQERRGDYFGGLSGDSAYHQHENQAAHCLS